MTAAMFKYRLMSKSKIPLRNGLKRYIKKIGLLTLALMVILVIYLQLRITRLSTFKDLAESRTIELNEELKTLLHFEEPKDSWKTPKITDSRIFAAYLDTRPEVVLEEDSDLTYDHSAWALIRIIAIIPMDLVSTPLTCYFKYRHSDEPSKTFIVKKPSMRSQLVTFPENFGMAYSAAYILCPLPYPKDLTTNKIKLPFAVTASMDSNRRIDPIGDDEFVVIRYPKNGWNKSTSYDETKLFSVCVQPLHHKFDKVIDLIAFIEYYRMMGVGHFTFYRDSVTERVDSALNYYRSDGVASVFEWKLPNFYIFERTLRVDGIYAALNDCLYRSTFHLGSRYVAGVDVDEYIVPRMHKNFKKMMEYLNPPSTNTWTGAWIFRNVFYYLMYDDDAVTQPPGVPKLNFHVKTKRWELVNPIHDRSKFIVQGRDVIELGNHRIWKTKRMWSIFNKRYKEVEVDPNVGTSNHYRNCETEEDRCWRREMIVDKTAHRFTEELGQRVARVMKEIYSNSHR